MSPKQAMEMALDCLLYYQSRETYPQSTTPTSKTIEALRAALAEGESPKAEPVTDAIGFVLYARGWETEREDIEHFSDAMLAKIVHGWRKSMPDALTAEHSGDCTKQPWTCIRCSFERIHSDANRIARAVLAAARGKG